MDNLELPDEKGWIGAKVKCDLCDHIWIAVFHETSIRLECPYCKNIVDFEIITDVNEDNRT